MPPIELPNHILSKYKTDSSIVIGPALDIDLWIRPEQITKKASIRYILGPRLLIDTLKIVEVRAEAAVHTQDTIIDDGCDRQYIEASAKLSPDSHVVPALALIVEAVHPVDGLALVITSQQVEVLRELDLVGKQQRDGLDALLASVNVVADKQKLLVILRVPSYVEKSEQIEVLSVHIAKYFNWSFEIQQHLLGLKYFCTFVDQVLECFLVQLHRLAPLPAFNLDKLLDDAVSHKLFLVIRGWLYEVLAVLELLDHLIDLPWGQIVLGAIICNRLAILTILSLCNCASLGLSRRLDLVLHYLVLIYICNFFKYLLINLKR